MKVGSSGKYISTESSLIWQLSSLPTLPNRESKRPICLSRSPDQHSCVTCSTLISSSSISRILILSFGSIYSWATALKESLHFFFLEWSCFHNHQHAHYHILLTVGSRDYEFAEHFGVFSANILSKVYIFQIRIIDYIRCCYCIRATFRQNVFYKIIRCPKCSRSRGSIATVIIIWRSCQADAEKLTMFSLHRIKRDVSFDWGNTEIRGVNIGGWLVLEPYVIFE